MDERLFTGEMPLPNGKDQPVIMLDDLRITDATVIPEAEPRILLDGQTLAEPGNIMGISGAAKSGKSAFANIILACAVGDTEGSIPEITVKENVSNYAVIQIDTEQTKAKQQKNILSLMKRTSRSTYPQNLYCYNIQTLPIETFEDYTNQIFEKAFNDCGGIHLAVIDGSADYVKSVNDEERSNANIAYFMALAKKYNTVIILLIHTNPNSDKERGNYGSQLQRKIQSLLTVKKADEDKNIITIEPKFLRDAGYECPAITLRFVREKGYHVYAGSRAAAGITKDFAAKIFGQAALKYGEAIEKIMKQTGYKQRHAKSIFTDLKDFEYIFQNENDKLWRLYNGK